ncbi:hypothetical protein CANCADRAFT_805 [Tortispora caseinolytica NRRL Y-17796]|uniref:SET domain-containing protein n=1 Tax=Tortispora caseinolytica NRRL Y-17796 TaxID=767744 RepID=A0A1E4TKF5_9ASCO|nr:hypothetical protein CANCADRAFT_805 [Tortispora caseinolytica NRRL Y-17796]
MKFCEIRESATGGRGVFATQAIPRDTVVHSEQVPYASIIFKPFRNETCAYCFKWNSNRNMPVCAAIPGIRFCSTQCIEAWYLQYNYCGYLTSAIDSIVRYYNAHKDMRGEAAAPYLWDALETDQAPSLDLDETACNMAIYAASVLTRECVPTDDAQHQVEQACKLQSSLTELLQAIPEILQTYQGAFQILVRTIKKQPELTDKVTKEKVCYYFGIEAVNAFGIWEQPLFSDSECLGSAVYPEASFFNHSCDPNCGKSFIGSALVITTARDIPSDSELFIAYGSHKLPEDRDERVDYLQKRWFFTCQCPKCATT